MQFVANGPNIPDVLLQAHEENGIVFFCGAGISYPAGLPGFEGLVEHIYQIVGTCRTDIEQLAFGRKQFDATLDLLERRLPGQRIAVRKALAKSLQPNLRLKGATDTHEALLQLARNRKGALRLVTTNFDRIFERVAKRTKQTVNAYAAPMLPIPKSSRWNGVVYLHGLLPEKPDDSALHRLVLTSGDFGLAYLTERWAARFVSEMFRNYIVCFVGYSIDDPVLRYMMDALAADRMQGEITPQAYALADCEQGQEHRKTIEWTAKGVTPILYTRVGYDHSALHLSLKAWAETYRDGSLGTERIVVEHALARPWDSTKQDDFVGRMLWALSDKSGLPAKRFAEFNSVPAIEWLEALSELRLKHCDLARFGVSSRTDSDEKLCFSLIGRPTHHAYAPWMTLASGGVRHSQWDEVMRQLARWLVRHLNDPKLIIWLAQRGGQLHDGWSWLIENELNRFARLLHEGNISELDEIRANAPNAIPDLPMQSLWRLLLTGRVKSHWRMNLYRWMDSIKRDGLTTTLRLELRDFLAPKVTLTMPFKVRNEDQSVDGVNGSKRRVDCRLVLAADHVNSAIQVLPDELRAKIFPTLLCDFERLLRDALDILRELGDADDQNDPSYWHLPSITPHWQNRHFEDWVSLIELLRDAWLATRLTDPKRATRIAQNWFDLPYSTFKRLALFAASQNACIAPEQWVDWLLADDAWWLWSIATKREMMRLLISQSANLSANEQAKLEEAILTGPPRRMYKEGIEEADWQSLVDHLVWLRLAKLEEGCGQLSYAAKKHESALSLENPGWKLESNQSDEFYNWMSGSGDPDYEERSEVEIAPRKRQDLVPWLKEPARQRSMHYQDTWGVSCRTNFFHCSLALCDLAKEGTWPVGRWQVALQVWSEEGLAKRSARFLLPLVQTIPDDVLERLTGSVSWWLQTISKLINGQKTLFLDLCRRVLQLPLESGSDRIVNDAPIDDPVAEAINHSVGHITQALLDLWLKRAPNDNDRLPVDIEPFFTQLSDTGVARFRHGRVLLASRLITLFRVDQVWTERYLLPLLDWAVYPVEAKSTWDGFLWSPRLYRPLQIAFKLQFLATAQHYTELGEWGRQYAKLLTYAALDTADGYTQMDFQSAMFELPPEGLQEVAQALLQAIEGAGEQGENYWENRIQPFWKNVWPKSRDLATPLITEWLARLCIASRGKFPAAVNATLDWLQPLDDQDYVVHKLHESGLAGRFPEEALRMLNAVVKDRHWRASELSLCLESIYKAAPTLSTDYRYQKLSEYARKT
jgi:hypothetical protein